MVSTLARMFGTYFLMFATFSQLVIIHPYIYDLYLLLPCVLASFVVAPIVLRRITGNETLWVFLYANFAYLYIWMSWRDYALTIM